MKRTDVQRLLPEAFQRTATPGGPVAALLDVMEGLHAPSEAALAGFDACLDPRRCPEGFVPMLARWVDVDRFLGDDRERGVLAVAPGQLRELVAAAPSLARWRGTERGLVAFLETATGIVGFRIDDRVSDSLGRERAFHLRVSAPAAARAQRELIARIVESEKPLHLTYEVEYGKV